jgi:hypothetical protein
MRVRANTMGLAAIVLTELGQTLLSNWRSPLVLPLVTRRDPAVITRGVRGAIGAVGLVERVECDHVLVSQGEVEDLRV